MLKLFVLLLSALVTGYPLECNEHSVIHYLEKPTYDFSIRLLDRVTQETSGHFVFSPISTWLQLLTLADGAQGETLNEILNVTRQNMICARPAVKRLFNYLDVDLREIMKRRSVFIIDKLLNTKESFVNSVEMLITNRVIQTNFDTDSAMVNKITDEDTKDLVTNLLEDNDITKTVLLLSDISSLKADWKTPFNPAYTQQEPFYSSENVLKGYVNMMFQIGSFNFNDMPEIDAQAIELPFTERVSMILLRPIKGKAEHLFSKMKDIRPASILKSLNVKGPRIVNLKMPRFNITTRIENAPELLYDMGLKRMFSPSLANFKTISDYRVYASLMTTGYSLEVTEKGISARIAPETLIIEKYSTDISFNRPFVFMLIDKMTNVMLFAGIYSVPSVF